MTPPLAPARRPLGRLAWRLAWWALASVAGMLGVWRAESWRGARWETLLAPFTIAQPDFYVLAVALLAGWICTLWGPRVVRALGPPVGAGIYAYWALVVDGIGV